MSDAPQGPGWWQASDGKWYPPEQAPGATAEPAPFQPYPATPVVAVENHPNAVISLVLGIVSLFACGLFTGIPAIILGSKARKEIDASGGRQGGRAFAVAGLITGWVGTILSVLGTLLFVALFVIGITAADGINTDPSDGWCNPDRFMQDPDC